MATRNSGKKVAAGITAAVILGSFSVVGIAAIAVGAITVSPTVTSGTTQNDGVQQDQLPVRRLACVQCWRYARRQLPLTRVSRLPVSACPFA